MESNSTTCNSSGEKAQEYPGENVKEEKVFTEMEPSSTNSFSEKDQEYPAKNVKGDNVFTEILETGIDVSYLPEECVITEEMVKEEEEIRDQLSEEENNFKKKMTDKDKEQSFQRLLNLLSRSQLYAKYLRDKMEEQKEQSARKQQQQLEQSRKRLEKQQKENIIQSTGRTTRGRLENNNSPNEQEPKGRKRGRGKSSDNNVQSSNQKRKKHANNNITVEKEKDYEDSMIQEDFQVDERLAGQISPRQPSLLIGGVMRDYQLEGFEWMKVLYENGINGILADEMGLGKTIQCISLVAHLVSKAMVGPYLIVAPLSTLPNWLAEFKRFTPQLPVILYHGDRDKRESLRRKISKEKNVGQLWTKPVVLTSYDIAIRDASKLRYHHWRYLIVDEGHRLKNFNSRLFIELKRYPAANRLLLTGTPLQNNLSELWSLLNFLLPEIFDNLTVFESWFDVNTISSGESNETIIAQEQEKRIISTLHEILNPFLLRRTKADVDLNLPPKKEIMVYAPLTSTQELFYKAVLDKSIFDLLKERSGESNSYFDAPVLESRRRSCVKHMDYSVFERDLTEKEWQLLDKAPPEDLTKTVHENPKTVQKIVQLSSEIKLNTRNMLMPLRKICNHPYLLEYPLDLETGAHKVDEDLVKVCGKLQILDCMLPALKKRGHKVLLFSQMTSLLNIIEDYCSLRKYAYVRLDGSTALDVRQSDIISFNKDPNIFLFLLSTRAGGLGINLTSADTVIIYDSDWNPQCDLQAQDRCHRFGQTKPVVVYRLVTANTIDEKIVTRASAKRKLEKMIMKKGRFSKSLGNSTTNNTSAFSPEELTELLKSTDHSGVVHTDSEQLLTTEQLDHLLDRSDLLSPNSDKLSNPVPQQEHGVFKLLNSDVNSSNVELSDGFPSEIGTD